ncbi:MAG: glucose 1-dehydrogenase [Thermoleophilia bacterium]|nr:glucose 1-dehydrogenase [Thermoleophilia bacterium]
MPDMLKDKVAIVTGGARGNGEGIARVFAAEGAAVCLWDVLPAVSQTAERIAAAFGRPVQAWRVDIGDADRVTQAAAEVLGAFGKVDILVNNAAIAPEVPFVEMDQQVRDQVWRVNVGGTMNCTQAVLPAMIERRSGKIIVISSVTGPLTAIPGLTMYASTKGALLGFTRNLALEVAPHGINVNCILPGTIDTPLLRCSLSGGGWASDYDVAAFGRGIPWGRVGSIEEIGGVAAFLASDWSNYVTGSEIVVDGGNRLTEWGLASE